MSCIARIRPAKAALAVALALGVAGCSGKSAQAPRNPVAPVSVAAAERKTVPIQIRTIGNVEAYSTVNVKSQVNGQLLQVHFGEGQDVAQGALLFTIDPAPFEAALKKDEATLVQDEAKLKNAKTQAARYDKLQEAGVVAREQNDQMQSNFEALEAAVNADRAQVQYDKVQLAYTKIYSPISGRTGNFQVHQGNVVKGNPDNGQLVTINQITPIYVNFSVPQHFFPRIKEFSARGKLKVSATVPAQPSAPEQGILSFIDNAVDLTTGTIRLKGTFQNPQRRLWPGQFVNVVLTLTEQPDAVVVPAQAVQTGQEGSYVFVVKADQTAESRPVSVGADYDGQVVIEKGVEPGEVVITDGQIRVIPGAKVEIKRGVQATEVRP